MVEARVSNRRTADQTHADIRDLILETDAPKDKAMLLILLRISESLDANTLLTEGTSVQVKSQGDAFDRHETKEQVMLSKVMGAWYVMSGLLVIILGVIGFWVKGYLEDFKELAGIVVMHETKVSDLRKDVNILQERNRMQDELARQRPPAGTGIVGK